MGGIDGRDQSTAARAGRSTILRACASDAYSAHLQQKHLNFGHHLRGEQLRKGASFDIAPAKALKCELLRSRKAHRHRLAVEPIQQRPVGLGVREAFVLKLFGKHVWSDRRVRSQPASVHHLHEGEELLEIAPSPVEVGRVVLGHLVFAWQVVILRLRPQLQHSHVRVGEEDGHLIERMLEKDVLLREAPDGAIRELPMLARPLVDARLRNL
eukprot:scaffold296833_cov30-Tisochrysis_lutea.AAC.2